VRPLTKPDSVLSVSQSQDLRARHGLCALFTIQLGEVVLHVRLHHLGDVEDSFVPSFVSHETLGV
jgi:hypothetical protein